MNVPRVRITILVDNHAGACLMAEHGLSLWIKTEDKRILFDTGQGSAFENNAQALGAELGKTDILVLSHGHYDHTGGIAQVVNVAGQVEVYCHPGAVLPRYSIRNGIPKPIQMTRESMRALDNMPAQRLHWVSEPVLLSENIGLTGPIPRETSYEDTGGLHLPNASDQRLEQTMRGLQSVSCEITLLEGNPLFAQDRTR